MFKRPLLFIKRNSLLNFRYINWCFENTILLFLKEIQTILKKEWQAREACQILGEK